MPNEETITRRVGADGETVDNPPEANEDSVVTADIPGDDESKFVTLRLAHPLNENDRLYLGLPQDAETEVNQQVRVNKNGAKALINAGYAQVDPEDNAAVRSVLRGEDPKSGEPTAEPEAEAPTNPAQNPPMDQRQAPASAKARQGAQAPAEGQKAQSGGDAGAAPAQ